MSKVVATAPASDWSHQDLVAYSRQQYSKTFSFCTIPLFCVDNQESFILSSCPNNMSGDAVLLSPIPWNSHAFSWKPMFTRHTARLLEQLGQNVRLLISYIKSGMIRKLLVETLLGHGLVSSHKLAVYADSTHARIPIGQQKPTPLCWAHIASWWGEESLGRRATLLGATWRLAKPTAQLIETGTRPRHSSVLHKYFEPQAKIVKEAKGSDNGRTRRLLHASWRWLIGRVAR